MYPRDIKVITDPKSKTDVSALAIFCVAAPTTFLVFTSVFVFVYSLSAKLLNQFLRKYLER